MVWKKQSWKALKMATELTLTISIESCVQKRIWSLSMINVTLMIHIEAIMWYGMKCSFLLHQSMDGIDLLTWSFDLCMCSNWAKANEQIKDLFILSNDKTKLFSKVGQVSYCEWNKSEKAKASSLKARVWIQEFLFTAKNFVNNHATLAASIPCALV